VNRSLPWFQLLTVLCCAALLCAQAFGVTRGYWCDCSGQAEWTAQDHCHGPHDASCHDDAATGPGHEESDGLGERRDHQEVRDEVQSRPVSTLEAPALVPLLVAVLDNEFAASMPARAWPSEAVAKWSRGSPPGVVVARTVVLLI
jgi:hypothetical protein